MRFRLIIRCDNAAFGDDEQERSDEVALILLGLIPRLNDGGGVATDSNENSVGTWIFTDECAR